MTHLFTIDELEKEIVYLREQNQKLIKELSQVVRENTEFREELALEGRQFHHKLTEAEQQDLYENSQHRQTEGGEGDFFCLN